MNADTTCLDALSEKVLNVVFEVSNTLGAGFLEKVYQRALLRELSLRGIRSGAWLLAGFEAFSYSGGRGESKLLEGGGYGLGRSKTVHCEDEAVGK